MSRVIFAVPPCSSEKGSAQATKNRQYQYFKDPTYIFPVIPATFLTMLFQTPGHNVLLIDSVAEEISEREFADMIFEMKPDYIVFEANYMLFDKYAEVINNIKEFSPGIKIILCGEHPTALYDEAKEKAKADFILKGGKWYKEAYKIITGSEWYKPIPIINRDISRWWLYAEHNGNFKYVPATYSMASEDCWYRPGGGACTFCSWVSYHPETFTREPEDVYEEFLHCAEMGFKEIFDDSGTFPVGKWLKKFCAKMKEPLDVNGRIAPLSDILAWGCNMRFGCLQPEDFKMMADAGCRFILWGFESANQKTLDKIKKGYKVEEVSKDLIHSRMAGIWNHLTVMMGYWWEDLEDEKRTYEMVKWLLLNDWAASVQSTVFMPYPGTESYKQAQEEGVLLETDWRKWDMTNQITKLKYPFEEVLNLQRKYYKISYHPKFIWNKLSKIKTWDDVKFYWRIAKKVINRFEGVHR